MSGFSIFIDTNIFLRVCVKDDKTQAKHCEKIIELIQGGYLTAITSDTVIAEFVWTSHSFYTLPKQAVIRMVKAIISLPNLYLEGTPDMLTATDLYEKYSVKFIDAIISSYELLRDGELPILSYDKDFDKLKVKRYEPVDVINILS